MNIVKVKDSKKSKSRTIRLYMSKVKFEDILFYLLNQRLLMRLKSGNS